MQTNSPASRSSLSARSGLISEVSSLIAQWFPTHDLEAVATAAADESPDGWLHFDLFITIGTVTYRKKQRYSSFCEGEIGRDLGQIETAHEARVKLAALVDSGLIDPASSEEVMAAVPMFGWEVFSTVCEICRRQPTDPPVEPKRCQKGLVLWLTGIGEQRAIRDKWGIPRESRSPRLWGDR